MSDFPFGALSEIAKGRRGVSYKPEDLVLSTEKQYCRLLTAGNIQDGNTTTNSYTKVSSRCVSHEQLISPDNILVCMSNGSKRLVGKSSRLRSSDSRQYCVGAFCSTFAPARDADPEFVFQIFQSETFKKQVSDALEGSAINNLKNSTIESFEIPIPPLPEQKKIAEILSGIDSNIQSHSTRLRVFQNIQNALFSEMPRKKEATKGALLGDIISAINSGWSPVCPPKARVGEEPAILKTTAITWEGYRPEENKALPPELASKDEAVVKSGDILCTRKGPRDRVGVVCYVSETPPNLMVPDTAFRIRTLEGIDPHYISLVLGSKEVQEEWNRKKVGLAEAQVNINHGILKEGNLEKLM